VRLVRIDLVPQLQWEDGNSVVSSLIRICLEPPTALGRRILLHVAATHRSTCGVWLTSDLVGKAEGVLLLGRMELDVRLPVRL
jgi:hypothetical protein